MSYIRVIPRDLFNEGNLLKCYGQIYINLERLNIAGIRLVHDGDAFDIRQDEGDGGLTITNVHFMVGTTRLNLRRTMNSREPYPLMVIGAEDEETPVFNDDGTFSSEFMFLLGSMSVTDTSGDDE